MTTLSSESMMVLLVVVAAGLVGFYGLILRREGQQDQRLNRRQIALLWILRFGAACLALATLARPAYRHVRTEERLPVLPLVVDESLSMGFPDTRDNPVVQASPAERRSRFDTATLVAQKLQEKLTRTHRVRVYTFSDALALLRELQQRTSESTAALSRDELFSAHPRPTGSYSNVGDALSDVLRDLGGEKVSAVVLLSDGRQTGGLDLAAAAELAGGARVPVHTIALGDEYPLRDLRIDEVIVGAEASLGDVLTFHVKVTNQISAPLAAELILEEKDAEKEAEAFKEIARRPLTLPRGQQVVTIATIPEIEGLRKFRLSLPRQPDEVNVENNVAEVTVKIVKRSLKVLLIASQPSREYYYLAPALLRDPVIDLSCYLQAADIDYVQQGKNTIERLPETVKDWQRYDVAILFDVDPNGITTQQLTGLENMVSRGGGLMVLGGRTHGLAKLIQVHAARMRGLLPVEVDKNQPLDHDRYHDRPFKVERTLKGKSHPILTAAADPTVNERIWSTFGKLDFWWQHPVQALKPKAISLLERTGAPSGENSCAMAIHRFEDGAVFYSGIDSLWLWRHPAESYDYDRMWTRIIRYLGEARLTGTQQQVALATDRRTYAPGEDVQISLRVLDAALMAQLAGQPLFAGVTSPAQDQFMVPLTPDSRGEPVFRGNYRAGRIGSLVVHTRQTAPDAPSDARPLFDVKHGFQVRMQSLEDADTSADLKALETLADRTGGRALDYRTMHQLDALVDAISTEPQVLTETITEEVWDGSVFLLVFLVLASTELCLRKWWGLL